MTVPPEELLPGYAHRHKGTSSYRGALRVTRRDPPVWTCTHDHFSPPVARRCAEAEKDRRVQAAKEVLQLLHCMPCDLYFGENGREASDRLGECPYCDVPLGVVKVMVLERSA